MNADERLVADTLARLRRIADADGDGDPGDHQAVSAHLQHVILSRLTAAQAATILRQMTIDAIEHFGDRRGEPPGVTGGAFGGMDMHAVAILAWEHTWPGTVYRMRRYAERAGVHVPGGKYFWNEGHFSYLGRRHIARRSGAAA